MGQKHSKRRLQAEVHIPHPEQRPPQPEPYRPSTLLYHPLRHGEIRTLCLEPGEHGSPLRGFFRYTTLPQERLVEAEDFDDDVSSCGATRGDALVDEAREPDTLDAFILAYEAISYAWGEPTYLHDMVISDLHNLRLTDSLYTALQHLRRSDERRDLWADAVCINQSDNVEKSAQVVMMARIYKSATDVIIWLGESVPSDALAYRAIDVLWGRQFERLAWDEARKEELNEAVSEARRRIRSEAHCPCCKTEFDGRHASIGKYVIPSLSCVLERPWFTRLWVVQEVVCRLRQTRVYIHCGTHRARFSDLRSAVRQVTIILATDRLSNGSESKISRFLRAADAIDDNVFGWEYDNSSSQLFWKRYTGLVTRQCSNPRDRVYAIRSFSGIGHETSLSPDYTISSSELYRRFALALMDRRTFEHGDPPGEDKPWAVLSLALAEPRTSATLDLPSWVPDLHNLTTRSIGTIEKHIGIGADDEQFPADSRYFQTRLVQGDDSLLGIRGRCFTEIANILPGTEYPNSPSNTRSKDRNEALAIWYEACFAAAFAQVSEDTQPRKTADAFHHFLASGTRLYGHTSVSENSASLRDRLALSWRSKITAAGLDHSPDLGTDSFAEDIVRQPSAFRGHALCRTRNARGEEDIACLPEIAQVGDQLCILGGCPYPFLVRHDGNGAFKLIGDAHILNTTFAQALGATAKRERQKPIPEWSSAESDAYFDTWEAVGNVEFRNAGDCINRAPEEDLAAYLNTVSLHERREFWRKENGRLILGLGWLRFS